MFENGDRELCQFRIGRRLNELRGDRFDLGQTLFKVWHPRNAARQREHVADEVDRQEAVRKLVAARATVHIISYTEFVMQKNPKKDVGPVSGGPRPPSSDPITATDPTLPPGVTRSPSYGISIRFDPAMRRQRKAYEAEVKRSQQELKNVADETGGKLMLPLNRDEMLAQAREVAQAIGAEYVVTYRPKRPLAEASPGEYRKIEVASRRVGLSLHARRGYVVPIP